MTREQLLEERCARFKDLIQFLSFCVDPCTSLEKKALDMYHGGRLTFNDWRYLSDLPELETEQVVKPPLGVMPRNFWNRKRQEELAAAMQRYLEVGKSIPREWIDEYNELSDEEK